MPCTSPSFPSPKQLAPPWNRTWQRTTPLCAPDRYLLAAVRDSRAPTDVEPSTALEVFAVAHPVPPGKGCFRPQRTFVLLVFDELFAALFASSLNIVFLPASLQFCRSAASGFTGYGFCGFLLCLFAALLSLPLQCALAAALVFSNFTRVFRLMPQGTQPPQ